MGGNGSGGGGLLVYFPYYDDENFSKVSNKTPVLVLMKEKNSHNEDCFNVKSFKEIQTKNANQQ